MFFSLLHSPSQDIFCSCWLMSLAVCPFCETYWMGLGPNASSNHDAMQAGLLLFWPFIFGILPHEGMLPIWSLVSLLMMHQ